MKNPLLLALLVLGTLLPVAARGQPPDELRLAIPHINYDDVGTKSTAAILAQMGLIGLGSGAGPTLTTIFLYGRGLDPAFSPVLEFSESMLAGTMDHFETERDYDYVVVTTPDFAEIVRVIAASMNRIIPDVAPCPDHAPAFIPLGGVYDHWAVVTGTRADVDPYLNPEATIEGFWLDDPRIYNLDPDGNLLDTNIFYSTDPGGLDAVYQPMSVGPSAGRYVAVVHMTDFPVPARAKSWGRIKARYR